MSKSKNFPHQKSILLVFLKMSSNTDYPSCSNNRSLSIAITSIVFIYLWHVLIHFRLRISAQQKQVTQWKLNLRACKSLDSVCWIFLPSNQIIQITNVLVGAANSKSNWLKKLNLIAIHFRHRVWGPSGRFLSTWRHMRLKCDWLKK